MVSLDGFFEGPNQELDWHNVDAEFNEFATAQLDASGVLLFGHKTYDIMAAFWPTKIALEGDAIVAKQMNSLPKIVFSRSQMEVNWSNSRLVTGNISDEISNLKQQPGKDIAVFGSSNLCVNLLEMDLLDELRIMVNPVLLASGHRLFDGLDSEVGLSLQNSRQFRSGNVLLTYQPKAD